MKSQIRQISAEQSKKSLGMSWQIIGFDRPLSVVPNRAGDTVTSVTRFNTQAQLKHINHIDIVDIVAVQNKRPAAGFWHPPGPKSMACVDTSAARTSGTDFRSGSLRGFPCKFDEVAGELDSTKVLQKTQTRICLRS